MGHRAWCLTVSLCVAALLPAVTASRPAQADYAPEAHDVVGVGSSILQYGLDFGADGDPLGDPGYNSIGNAYKLVSIDATADANGRAAYLAGSTAAAPAPLNPTVVLRSQTYPAQRPDDSSAGISALIADTSGADPSLDFVRTSGPPTAAENAAVPGGLVSVLLGTDTLRIAADSAQTNAPAGLSGQQLAAIYECADTKWTQVGGSSAATIIPAIPPAGSDARSTFLAGLAAANGGTAVTPGSCVIAAGENDPAGITANADPADVIEPFSASQLNLWTGASGNQILAPGSGSGFFHNPASAYPGTATALSPGIKLLTGSPSGGNPDYEGTTSMYVVYPDSAETSATPWQPGGTLNWAQTLFCDPGGPEPFFASPAGQVDLAESGITPQYGCTLPIPPAAGPLVCGQPALQSPFGYDGAAGAYSSGTAGLPTYGTPGSNFPQDTAGVVIPPGAASYQSYQLSPDTVYYLLPGVHTGGFQADTNDAFVGGLSGGAGSVLSGGYSAAEQSAVDSNSTLGNQPGVTVEYLTIEEYTPDGDGAAVNQDSNTNWTIADNTITLNVPGAGVIAGAGNVIKNNCLTLNGQYGFQSEDTDSWGADSITGGPYDVMVEGNEISDNDTCDFEGLLSNPAIGWSNYNPVPAADRNPNCGTVVPDGNEGGFKLWETDGVTVRGNYIHDNWGPGAWVDTDNANTTISGNTFTGNDGPAVVEEISYNFSVTDNYLASNDWIEGLGNAGFPQPAIYVSESGSDTTFGGVPACPEAACDGQGAYTSQSVISGNMLVNNGGGVFLWEDADRYCSDGFDDGCTLIDGASAGPFSTASCAANLPAASVNTATYRGNVTGSPQEDWWDGCQWRTTNVSVTSNTIDFNPADITDCTATDWPDCGANGIFSDYGDPPGAQPPWAAATDLTFFQDDVWAANTYAGPSTFFAWNQGNASAVSWANWTGSVAAGDKCSSSGEQQSGACTGPFGQDNGSTYSTQPPS